MTTPNTASEASKCTVTFPSYESFKYVEVFKVIEYRDGKVFKTKRIGFANRERTPQKDEIYAPLSTSLTEQPNITLVLI